MNRRIYAIALIAALQGAAGVALAAVAAHVDASPTLATASQFLMLHAAAGIGLAALCAASPLARTGLIYATFALQGGVTLFCADLALRATAHGKLFPFAAPIGGSATIAAWLAIAIWAALRLAKKEG
ncbi:DUF423 domain-containing protein [Methylocystis heyeri]|uniref:DUF423 domain-containing protein n=1 Tax=Methylocystis heyeri TaxID=391905 RepID=A0A6B8KAD0_9HYPH|nr:DUF423 domain-containing protein [Methylocystis heyeri]QGM44809.1 DUF423 domain-containing protein [Methylocystis heyeri]